MKKIAELQAKFETLKNEAQALLDENKIAEAKEKMKEVKNIKESIAIQEELDKEAEDTMDSKRAKEPTAKKEKETANSVRAIIKACMGRSLSEAENSLLVHTPGTGDGNGEGYLLPQDIKTIIVKKIRQYKSLREVLGYMPTTALTGSFPVEDFETLSELIDFEDGTEGTEVDDIKFTNVKFALKEKGALISLSNTLLNMTDNDLINYVAECFARKAVITENKMALVALAKDKTKKSIIDWKALKKSINVDLDTAVKYGLTIITNQDGFNVLDEALDDMGRPILQPNPKDPTQKIFLGYPVVEFSNGMIPTKSGKAPVIYGNLKEAVKFVDNGSFAFALSPHAGFTKNTTIARIIEYLDVVQVDSSDKIYLYGEMDIAPSADVIEKVIPVNTLPTTGQLTNAVYVLLAAEGEKAEGTMWKWKSNAWVEHTEA